jgi:hypothetical protein
MKTQLDNIEMQASGAIDELEQAKFRLGWLISRRPDFEVCTTQGQMRRTLDMMAQLQDAQGWIDKAARRLGILSSDLLDVGREVRSK